MLLVMKSELTPQDREDLRKEIAKVLATADDLQRTHESGDGGQRVVLTLPKHYLHMAAFLAVMDNESMPASLRYWQNACEGGADDGALRRKIGRKMRSYLEEELMIRTGVAMTQLKADADFPRSDDGRG